MTYSPLDENKSQIRLLHLHPASAENEKIQCHLTVESLEDQGLGFEALSYAWEQQNDFSASNEISLAKDQLSSNVEFSSDIAAHLSTRQSFVDVEGQDFPMTGNLLGALQHLRFQDQERRLWVDALCIDQSAISERNSQVSHMRTIYQNARKVIIWLGEEFKGVDIAVQSLSEMANNSELHLNPSLTPHLKAIDRIAHVRELFEALETFLTRPWWTRTWTVQEFILGRQREIRCGKFFLDGDSACSALANLYAHFRRNCCRQMGCNHAVDNFIEASKNLNSLSFVKQHHDNMSFFRKVSYFRGHIVSDSRDKIYGMLGFMGHSDEDFIKPDYNLFPEEVFETSILAAIHRHGSLEPLSHIPLSEKSNLALPSYVPDFTARASSAQRHTDWLNWIAGIADYSASRQTKARPTHIAPGKIELKGVVVDEIKRTTSALYSTTLTVPLDEMRELAEIKADSDDLFPGTDVTRNEAFGLTLVGDMQENIYAYDHGHVSTGRRTRVPDLSKFEEWWSTRVWGEPPITLDAEVFEIYKFYKSMSAGRKFVATNNARFGFAPERCQTGDLIAVLAGGNIPFVLRPAVVEGSPPRQWYRLIGDSYIHGIMDGEAFDEEQLDGICLV